MDVCKKLPFVDAIYVGIAVVAACSQIIIYLHFAYVCVGNWEWKKKWQN